MARHLEGLGELLEQPAADRHRLPLVRAVEEQAELVAAEPCDRVARAQDVLEPPGDRRQERISRIVPEAVVHSLEAVDVDDQHAERPARPRRERDRLVEAVAEQGPVRHSREAVVVGLVGELLLEPHAFGDVAGVHHDAAHMAVVAQVA